MHGPGVARQWSGDADLDAEIGFERESSAGKKDSARMSPRMSPRTSGVSRSSSRISSRSTGAQTPVKGNRKIILKAAGVLILVAAMISACLAGFLSEESRKQADFRTSVSDLGLMYANEIERQVRSSVSSVRALEAMIKVDDKNLTTDNFDTIAQTLIDTYQGISNLQLAPYGTVTYIVPLVGPGQDNRGAIGHALLIDPNRRAGALSAITRRTTTVIGPLRLIQGGVAVLARHPIFSKFAPEFVPPESWTGKDGTSHSLDCATPATQRANCYFPGPTEGNSTATHFWGFATMLTLVTDLLAPVKLERLEQGRHHIEGVSRFAYQLLDASPHNSMKDVNGIFAHSAEVPPGGSGLKDPVEIPVAVPELGMRFVLHLAPKDGWPATSGDFWVQVALLFPLTILVAVGMSFMLLGNMRATYIRNKGLEQYRYGRLQQRVSAAVSDLDRFHFPMCVMAVDDFERLGELVQHEVARDSGKLQFVDKAEIIRQMRDEEGVVFISHQWAGFDAPDPDGVQYRAMLDAIVALQRKGISCRWIWVDYLCIPQQNKSQQQNAIDSLTVYVSHSSVFVTVAPATKHANIDVTLDMMSYSDRGWCRLEQLSYLAATISRDAPAAYAATENGFGMLWGKKGMCSEEAALRVVEGHFTCCSRNHPGKCACDKTKIVGVMLGLYWRLLAWQRDLPVASNRLTKMLQRFERAAEELFPSTVEYKSDGASKDQVEVFGDLIPVLREMFEADSLLPPEDRIKVSAPSTAAMATLSKDELPPYTELVLPKAPVEQEPEAPEAVPTCGVCSPLRVVGHQSL